MWWIGHTSNQNMSMTKIQQFNEIFGDPLYINNHLSSIWLWNYMYLISVDFNEYVVRRGTWIALITYHFTYFLILTYADVNMLLKNTCAIRYTSEFSRKLYVIISVFCLPINSVNKFNDRYKKSLCSCSAMLFGKLY